MTFRLIQTTDAWQITDATGQPLKSLTGNQLIQDTNEALMNRLWSALRHLDASSLKDGVVRDKEAEGIYASQGFTRSTLNRQEWKSMQQVLPRTIALLERVHLFTCP